jgi:hypothetical protein
LFFLQNGLFFCNFARWRLGRNPQLRRTAPEVRSAEREEPEKDLAAAESYVGRLSTHTRQSMFSGADLQRYATPLADFDAGV